MYKEASKAMKKAAEVGTWNFENKAHLLKAEWYSFKKKKEDARTAYAAAISASRASKFIHEEALSCECAGHHFQKYGDKATALDMLRRAKECYEEWGCVVRVESVTRQIEKLSPKAKKEDNANVLDIISKSMVIKQLLWICLGEPRSAMKSGAVL